MLKKYTSKTAEKNDQDFLFEMLYQSIYVKPFSPKPDRTIIENPAISRYVANWGKQGDVALIALDEDGNKVGAVWLRYFNSANKGYGFISERIPEMGIAVEQKHRGNGAGSFLLEEILQRTKKDVQSISLSVNASNPAWELYRRYGFYEYSRDGESIIMRYDNS